MTRHSDFIGLVEGYLDDVEGHTHLPDATRDAIRARLPLTSQRPAWWPGWRFRDMNGIMKSTLAVAAVAVAAVLGLNYLSGSNIGGPVPGPTSTPSPTAAPLPPSGSALEAGRYRLQVVGSPMTATFAAAEGWNSEGLYIEQPEHDMQLAIWKARRVYVDACSPSSGAVQASEMSVDDLVQTLDDQVSTDLSEPSAVAVGGYDGVRVELATSNGIDPATCDGQSLYAWVGASDSIRSHSGSDALWILDVDGDTIIVLAAYELGDPAAEAAAQEVVDTIEFDGA